MRLIIFIFLFSIFAQADDLIIAVGETKKIANSVAGAVKVKGRKTISVQPLQRNLIVHGLSAGQATIATPQTTHQIFVIENSKIEFFKSLKQLVSEFLDLRVEWAMGEIVVYGQLHRLSDWQEIIKLAQDLNGTFFMRAQLDEDIQTETQKWLRAQLSASLQIETPVFLNQGAVVYFSEELKSASTSMQKRLGPYGIEVKYEKNALAIAPLVRVRIVVAEVNKAVQSQLGIQWPESVSAQIVPKFNGISAFEIFLKAVEEKGMGQILASPNLLARSGSEAEFLAGGEFGIKIVRGKQRDVIWKKHGILLKMKPKADTAGRLSIELTTEVSLIDVAQSVDGIPALKTNRISTHFDLNQARTIVLSGLIRNDWGRSASGVWGLSDIPIIGSIFRSENFFNNKTELVIFVTPEIVRYEDTEAKNPMPKSWVNHD